mmetsp:Transcript_27935/g.80110  ORF Transcript_27935/g.80110 Transcript_27935/m.80110 type:complete len:226 (+) Transcript_27935:457-1134(+)
MLRLRDGGPGAGRHGRPRRQVALVGHSHGGLVADDHCSHGLHEGPRPRIRGPRRMDHRRLRWHGEALGRQPRRASSGRQGRRSRRRGSCGYGAVLRRHRGPWPPRGGWRRIPRRRLVRDGRRHGGEGLGPGLGGHAVAPTGGRALQGDHLRESDRRRHRAPYRLLRRLRQDLPGLRPRAQLDLPAARTGDVRVLAARRLGLRRRPRRRPVDHEAPEARPRRRGSS